MPRRQTEVEQCGDLHRLQQADGAEREAFTLTEFSEMLVAPGEQFLCRTLAVGKIGKVGSAVGQMGEEFPALLRSTAKGTAWSRITTPN